MLKDLVAIQAGCTIDAAERKIMAGEVFSGNARLTHPGEKFDSEMKLYIKENCPYVSRGAYKLLKFKQIRKLDNIWSIKNRLLPSKWEQPVLNVYFR